MASDLSREVDLGREPVGKLLVTLAVPAITSQVVNVLYNMVDRMYIGHIPDVGDIALTGVGVTFPLIMIISAFAALMGFGSASRASIYMGRRDNHMAEQILGNSFTALTITSVLLTAATLLFLEPLLYLFGASENTIGYALDYMEIYAMGTLFVQLTLGLNTFISAQGFSKISMLTVMIGAVTNIILDPVLIFACGMGVRGAALATVLSQAISALWALKFLSGPKTVLRLKRENFRIRKQVLLPGIALGVSPFVMQSTESLLTLCFNTSLRAYGGDMAVGAMTICSSVMQFAMLPLQGLTQGGQPILSYNYGANQAGRVKEAFRLVLTCCLSFSAVLWLLVQLFPGVFVGIFTDSENLAPLAIWALRIYSASMCLFGAQIACQQSFIAFGNARVSAFLAMFRKILLLIPLIYLLPHFFSDKVFAVFLAEPIADAIAVCTTVTLFTRSFRSLTREMEARARETH